jgi:hypothetical protein
VEPLSFEIEQLTVLAKASRGAEFSFSSAPPPAARAFAEAWVQAQLAAEVPWLGVLQRGGDGWWLLGVVEDGFDRADRPKSRGYLGRLRQPPGPNYVTGLLDSWVALGQRKAVARQVIARPTQQNPLELREATGAAVCLALGHTAALPRKSAAAYALDLAGLDGLAWAATAPGPLPLAAVPPGPGLLVGVEAALPEEVAQLLDEAPTPKDLLALDLDALAALPEGPADRLRLARAGLDPRAELPEAPSVPALAWLARRPKGVARALPLLRGDDDLADWLGRLRLRDGKELPLLKGRLRPQHRDLVCRVLNALPDQHDAFGHYHGLFPEETAPRLDLLDEPLRQAWEGLERENGEAAVRASAAEGLAALLKGCEVRPRYGLGGLAAAAAVCDFFRADLARLLVERLRLPDEVVKGLFAARPTRLAPPPEEAAPADEPRPEWLRGVPPDSFLQAGAGWRPETRWGRWWLAGVRLLCAEGKVSRPAAYEVGLLQRDAALLEYGGAAEGVRRLADPKGGALAEPPAAWETRAAPLLRRLIAGGELWRRVIELTPEWWEWLAVVVTEADEKRLVRDLRDWLERGRPLPEVVAKRMVPALPRRDLLAQVTAWTTEPPERAKAADVLRALLDSPRLSAGERDWLDRRLLRCGDPYPRPPWSAADLLALLPLLEPVGEVVRVVLNRPVAAAEKADEARLLEATAARLADLRSLPPPPADRTQQERRPAWVERLARLPGWAWFGGDAATPQGEG